MAEFLSNITDYEEDDISGRFLTFFIEHEIFGIELRNVLEIVGIQPITKFRKCPTILRASLTCEGK
jgi:purine-binding chemotaxis protein CheW